MARRKRDSPGLSLFPFLSVLAAVMGTLILVISGMSQLALASPRQGVEVLPFDPGKKSPIFVECRHTFVRIYDHASGSNDDGTSNDETESSKYVSVPRSELGNPRGPWARTLARAKYGHRHFLMLLVREDGVRTFKRIRDQTREHEIDIGYEPLYGDAPVRFRDVVLEDAVPTDAVPTDVDSTDAVPRGESL